MKIDIGFIGGGRMASAICDGLLKTNPMLNMAVSDPLLTDEKWGARPCKVLSTKELFCSSQWLVWAVKPQVFKSEVELWKSLSFTGKGMISVMAGIPCSAIENIYENVPVVRTMPNTPMILGQGMVGLACGQMATSSHIDEVESFFKPIAQTLRVEESQLDGVTAISGSGPAYVFYLAEEVMRRSSELGLEAEQALKLWAQTLKGAAAMLEGPTGPEELRRQVTSPGGTTQAAIETFSKEHLDQAFGRGLKAAYNRSVELSK